MQRGSEPHPDPTLFMLRYGISRSRDPQAPFTIAPSPHVCHGGALRPTVLAAAVDIVGSLFAREIAGSDRISTIDLSLRAPLRPVPERIVARGALLRGGRSLVASETALEADGAAFGYGQATFLRAPPPASDGGAARPEPVGLPETFESVPLDRPLAEEAGLVRSDPGRGRVELPLGPACLSPQGTLQGGLVALVVEEAALALAEHDGAGPHVVTELDLRYLAAGRRGPIVSAAEWVAGREAGTIRVRVYDAGQGDRITTAGLARVVRAPAQTG
jgi:acyl-coenzyme A thioesterase PaaI-like protein